MRDMGSGATTTSKKRIHARLICAFAHLRPFLVQAGSRREGFETRIHLSATGASGRAGGPMTRDVYDRQAGSARHWAARRRRGRRRGRSKLCRCKSRCRRRLRFAGGRPWLGFRATTGDGWQWMGREGVPCRAGALTGLGAPLTAGACKFHVHVHVFVCVAGAGEPLRFLSFFLSALLRRLQRPASQLPLPVPSWPSWPSRPSHLALLALPALPPGVTPAPPHHPRCHPLCPPPPCPGGAFVLLPVPFLAHAACACACAWVPLRLAARLPCSSTSCPLAPLQPSEPAAGIAISLPRPGPPPAIHRAASRCWPSNASDQVGPTPAQLHPSNLSRHPSF
ncbi:hypothetical protein BS50DRAFT_197109 [Corynespora cassiicola Philippines]|uniref:Uncharacterized protein n=1 Tax=Corynespora cassiicola Philippines TaxID=1448308 RepID=A0A2T2N654_CORCC|nr:hypothetical protein BS50DRAFT_197109 [Corynespora cassiicola Philippines]